jgi:hypothetical protein
MRILGNHATFATAAGVRALGDLTLRAQVARAEAHEARELAKTLDDELFATLREMRDAGMKWDAIAFRLKENLTTLHNFYHRRSTGRRQLAEVDVA